MDQIYNSMKNPWPSSILGVAPLQGFWLPKVYLLKAFNEYCFYYLNFV